MSEKYQSKLKRLWQVALAESVKVFTLAIAGWAILSVLSGLFDNIGMNNFQVVLKLFYIILMVLLVLLALRPIARTLFKVNYVAAIWLLLFMILNLAVIGIIILWLLLIIVDFEGVFNLLKGPFNVTVYLS